MTGAGEALMIAAIARLATIRALTGVHENAPIQAARPFATVETGPETDWSHKTGLGREVRLAVTVRDKGERPGRLRALMAAVEAEMADLGSIPGWTTINLRFLRSRVIAEGRAAWAGVLDYRVRLLAAP